MFFFRVTHIAHHCLVKSNFNEGRYFQLLSETKIVIYQKYYVCFHQRSLSPLWSLNFANHAKNYFQLTNTFLPIHRFCVAISKYATKRAHIKEILFADIAPD